jgi:hypothetical protein
MHGYAVLIEELVEEPEELLLVDAQDAVERYAVPSAFAAYWNAIREEVEVYKNP